MKTLNKHMINLTGILALGFSGSLFAHVNVASDSSLTVGEESREYVEGSRAYINLNLPEDCATEDRSQRFAITSAVVIFPNGEALTEDFYTTGHGSEEHFSATATMGVKARASSNWVQVGAESGAVPPYGSRAKTVDNRALKWLGGNLKTTSVYDNAEFVLKLPKIEASSCVAKVRVEIPSITYCEDGNMRAWIGTPNSKFKDAPKIVVEEEYEPYFYIVRAEDNPLGDSCGEGEEMTVRPSDADINQYSGDWVQESADNPYK